ncbi:MAG: hypothetical protein IJC51_04090 [Eggerthellaceae bacterium]|nr:hypothetical protein [Eggerthellaceae bacterium]
MGRACAWGALGVCEGAGRGAGGSMGLDVLAETRGAGRWRGAGGSMGLDAWELFVDGTMVASGTGDFARECFEHCAQT